MLWLAEDHRRMCAIRKLRDECEENMRIKERM